MSNVITNPVSAKPATKATKTTRKPAAKKVENLGVLKTVHPTIEEQIEASMPLIDADLKAAKAAKATKATKATEVKDYTYLADKEPTELHEAMAAWITEQTGVEITAKQAQLVAVLRHEFQRSDENQQALAAKRDAAETKRKAAEAAKEAKEREEFERLQAKFAAAK